ncbi:ABC transporter permease [Candidatus Geothermarchaeota archaeon]|nr:MAG: ABC transporter permease [Candidatus Geothermarchaeota archaeon]
MEASKTVERILGPEKAEIIYRFLQPTSAVGLIILMIILALSLLAPYIAPYSPYDAYPGENLKPPLSQGVHGLHLFGTDSLGRDIFSRVIYAVRIDLYIALVSVSIAAFFGTLIGLFSSYLGGWIDNILMRAMDALISIPGFILAIGISASLGPSLLNAMIAISIVTIPLYARLMRGVSMVIKNELYIEAAKELGASHLRIIFKHIFPNCLVPLIVQFTLDLGGAIITATGLSFLGLGAQEPTPELGLILSIGRNYLRNAWWMSTFPGLFIFLIVLSFNLIGDGLRDALDPRLRGVIR